MTLQNVVEEPPCQGRRMGFQVGCIWCSGCHGLGMPRLRGEGSELQQKAELAPDGCSILAKGGRERVQ